MRMRNDGGASWIEILEAWKTTLHHNPLSLSPSTQHSTNTIAFLALSRFILGHSISMEGENKKSGVSDVGAWAMNVVSSVGIIMANKQLMSSTGYAFAFGIYVSLVFVYIYRNITEQISQI